MKKLIIFFSALALISSCAKMEETGPVQNDQSNDSGHPKVLNASVVDEQDTETRTYVDGKTVMWQPGDIISHFYHTHSNVPYIYNGETPASNVELEYYSDIDNSGIVNPAVKYSRSVYPFDSQTAITVEDGVDKIHVSYPTAQTYAQNSFGRGANLMIATGETSSSDEVQYFRNACGYLVIKLYGKATVKSITLSAVDGVSKIAGKATIVTDENKIPVATMSDDASTSVTLDCSNNGGVALSTDQNEPTEFWFALPPVEIKGGIRIVVTDINDNIYTKQTTKDVNITRNNVQPMAALQFVSNIPASNKIWYTKVADAPSGRITFGNEQANPFDATIIDHYYDSSVGKYVIAFDRPVKTIKAKAFYSTAIKTIELPDGLETIEEGAFGYTQIPAITIPGSVNTIKTEAFSTCGLLKSIVFLPSPTQTPLTIACSQRSLADFGPFESASFTSIHLNRELNYVYPDGNSFVAGQLDDAIFYNKYPAPSVSVTLGSQVRTVFDYMFSGLMFSSLTIPGTVNTIGDDVFNECTALTSLVFEPSPTRENLTIGANWEGWEEGIFVDCPLQTISLNRQLEYSHSPNLGLFSGNSLGDGITLGEQVHTVLPYMFTKSGITSLSIPATVMKIHNYAFYGCTELSSIRFEASATPLTIGFQEPSDLANEVGPFYQSPLTNIYVNRELVPSESYAAKLDQTDEGIFSMSFDDAVVTVTLGENVKTISDYMFSGVQMQSLTIPGSVTTIGNDVFNGCDKLTSLTFEPSPTNAALTLGYNTEDEEDGPFLDSPLTQVNLDREIIYTLENIDLDADDEGIFSGRPLTDGVTLGNQVRTLSPYMFSNSGITSLKIPASVEEIKDYAFYNCTSLASVRFEAGTEPLTIGFQPGTNEHGPFYQSPLTSIYVNRELVASEAYAAARNQTDEGIFSTPSNNRNVTVTLQGNVNTISDYMFSGVNMQTIWIPREVTTICKGAFYNCSSLYGMTLAHTGPPTLIEDENGGAFKGTLLNNPDVQMRWIALEDGSDANIEAFKSAHNWVYYAYIIKAQIKK